MIRNYRSFKGHMTIISHQNFYQTLYSNAYNESVKQLSLLETFKPDLYKEWLEKWKAERR